MKRKAEKSMIVFTILFLSAGLFFCFTKGAYAEEQKEPRKILYYRNSMNPSVTSDVPAKDSMGMDFIPVYEEARRQDSKNTASQKKIKYWTCGMHPQVKQDKPGNCPICNMNLVPVYEEDGIQAGDSSQQAVIRLSARDVSLAGVESFAVSF